MKDMEKRGNSVAAVTYADLYTAVEAQLRDAGCDSPGFEAGCLLEDLGGLPRGHSPRHDQTAVPAARERTIRAAAAQRAEGRPLQYILGQWDFLNLTLSVGEGVLIPRPETELLCEAAAARLPRVPVPQEGRRVLDLCAGSGCVSLGLTSLYPAASVTAVELSPAAFRYLEENLYRYPGSRVWPIRADVLTDAPCFGGCYQAVVSNPPYIPSDELPTLMREVRREPRMALDGGDGYRFYRAIAQQWVPKLCPGGFCAVEVGQGQAQTVAALWKGAGLTGLEILPDLAGIDRVVIGWNTKQNICSEF